MAGRTDEAIQVLEELASQGVPQAHHTAGQFSPERRQAGGALVHYQTAAAARFAATFAPASEASYFGGQGVERDVWKAVAYYYDGTLFEEVDCLLLLGEIAASGELGEVAHDVSMPLYKRAAACGSARAMRRLGFYYWKGEHIEQDLGRASAAFSKTQPNWAKRLRPITLA